MLTPRTFILGFRYPSVTADSGYESEEGYSYLREQKQKPYIKPQTYESMGYHLNKLHAKIQNDRTGKHLFPVEKPA